MPVIPGLSILLNIYLILMLDLNTWIRFTIWMAVGTYSSITVIQLLLHPDPLVIGFLPLLFAAGMLYLLPGDFHQFSLNTYTSFALPPSK